MKKIILLFLTILFFSCTVDHQTELNRLQKPITVVSKGKSQSNPGAWRVTFKDASGNLITLQDDSFESFNVGDIIKAEQ